LLFHFYVFFADEPFVPYAFLGVDFFFILSGFIITRQYEATIATHATGFKKFAVRRLARLYPLFIFSIALFLFVNHVYIEQTSIGETAVDLGEGPVFAWNVLMQLTMLGNIGGMIMPWNGPAWSVSVEWIVNLMFFAVVWKVRRIPTIAWIGMIVFCTVYLIDYSPKSLNLIYADPAIFNPTLARGLLGFALGALIFRYHTSLPALPWLNIFIMDMVLIGAVVLLITYYHSSSFVVGVDYVFLLLLFPPLITISLYRKSLIGWFLSLPPFTFLGKISYSLYLLHLPIGYAYQYSPYIHSLGLTRPMYGLVYVALVIVISTITFVLLETPFRLAGRRLVK